MKRRWKMKKRKSKKMFTRTASRTHKKNLKLKVPRGGYRL